MKPFIYVHELLNTHGVWIGCESRDVIEQSHTEGETGTEIIALYHENDMDTMNANRDSEKSMKAKARMQRDKVTNELEIQKARTAELLYVLELMIAQNGFMSHDEWDRTQKAIEDCR